MAYLTIEYQNATFKSNEEKNTHSHQAFVGYFIFIFYQQKTGIIENARFMFITCMQLKRI